jgi:hypothetical protein
VQHVSVSKKLHTLQTHVQGCAAAPSNANFNTP